MTAHVAEASERSGRVLLWIDPAERCPRHALEIPVRLAAAYGSEVETIVVAADFPPEGGQLPVRRVTLAKKSLPMPQFSENHELVLMATRHRRTVEHAGVAHGVVVRHAEAEGDAIDRIAQMCLARGPWNIVALSRTPSSGSDSLINALLANVSGATGILVCGRKPETWMARVVVVAEDSERLPSMLRAAERLTGGVGKIHVLVCADTAAEYADLDAAARLVVQSSPRVVFEPSAPTYGISGATIERVNQLRPSLVMARFGGVLVSDGRALSRAAAVTAAPFLLIR